MSEVLAPCRKREVYKLESVQCLSRGDLQEISMERRRKEKREGGRTDECPKISHLACSSPCYSFQRALVTGFPKGSCDEVVVFPSENFLSSDPEVGDRKLTAEHP